MKEVILLLFVLVSVRLPGQIFLDSLEAKYGAGELALKKKITVSFHYDEEEDRHYAKAYHRYETLHIKSGDNSSNGLVQVPFNMFQELKLKKARFYRLIDSTGEKSLLENVKVKYADVKDFYLRNVFYSDLKVKQFNCEVDLPESYFVSYSYEMTYNDLKFLTGFYLQEHGEAVEEVEVVVKKNPKVDFSLYDFNLGKYVTKTESDDAYTYRASKLQRINATNASVGGSYYLPHFVVCVKSVQKAKGREDVLSSAHSLYAWYSSLIQQLKPDNVYLKSLADEITSGAVTEEESIERIFSWVQHNVHYVAFEDGIAGFKPEEAHTVAKLKYGDCKGMANLLVALLQAKGFDSRHAWIGTRSKRYSYDMPSLTVDNHMICALYRNGTVYFLDATSKNASWQLAPAHLMGKQVMVAHGNEHSIETVPVISAEKNVLKVTGTVDVHQAQPVIKLLFELNGYHTKLLKSMFTYSSLADHKDMPYYFIRRYFDDLAVTSVSAPVFDGGTARFSAEAQAVKIHGTSDITIFPYLDCFGYRSISADGVPVYIDFPQVISVDITIDNAGKLCKDCNVNLKKGIEKLYSEFQVSQTAGAVKTHQRLYLDILYSSDMGNAAEWNQFVRYNNSLKNLPITY